MINLSKVEFMQEKLISAFRTTRADWEKSWYQGCDPEHIAAYYALGLDAKLGDVANNTKKDLPESVKQAFELIPRRQLEFNREILNRVFPNSCIKMESLKVAAKTRRQCKAYSEFTIATSDLLHA